jgi:DNA-binding NtrC family response regulator/signal transduction histidine kinase
VFAEVMQGASLGILVFDITKRRLLFSNREAATCLGLTGAAGEFERLAQSMVERPDIAGCERPLGNLELRHGRRLLGYSLFGSGPYRWVFFRDITEKARLESIAESIELSNSLAMVFATVRHEIGNPVNSVKMALSVLRRNLDRFPPEMVGDYLDRSLASLARVEDLLASLRSFSLAEDVKVEAVLLDDLVASFVDFVRRGYGASGIRLEQAACSCLGPVKADPRALHQILLNLFANAADAVMGRPDPCIRVVCASRDDLVELRIEDSGVGMSAEVLQQLFKPFFTTKAKGTGLGLAIARRMLARMGDPGVRERRGAWHHRPPDVPAGVSRGRRCLLLVDDEPLFAEALASELRRDGRLCVLLAATAAEARRLAGEELVDIVLLDQRLPDGDGAQLCPQLLAANPTAKVIFMTAHPSVDNARAAVRSGAFDYLPKPLGLDEILLAIRRCLTALELDQQSSLRQYRHGRERAETVLVGDGPAMTRVGELVALAAGSDAPVLLTGETGTGKSHVAKAIHLASTRREAELVSVNCAAIPEALLESELFGSRRGAFTGAAADRSGLVELADGGTLLLDEIADLPLALQPKLLHVLEERVVRPVGGGRARSVDFRLLAATNADVERAVAAGRLRADLFYRLDVVRIHLPPLRERREDVPALAAHLLAKVAGPSVGLAPGEAALLARYDWPGNLRELRNVLERAHLLARGGAIRPSLLLAAPSPPASPVLVTGQGAPLALADVERAAVAAALDWSGGNRTRAARALGVSLSTLKRRLADLA